MFGKYKHSITNTLVENYANKENFKKSFKGVMSPLKENKTAREFFVLYGEIENKRFDDKKLAESYLDEVISVLKTKKKNLIIPTISEGLGAKSESYNKIYSQLDSLVFNDAVRSIEKNLRNKRSLIEHLTRKESTKQTNKAVPMSLLSHLLTRKFNEKYSSLSEEDKSKLRKLSSLDKNELEDKVIKLKESTLSKLNSLKESSEDKDMKNKIQEVCESLDNSGVNITSILKMEKLNKSLIK
tara:strand:+ start:6235 stop:6957 length:723 start_codon:yes stop_codon:yes gene_type:complete